MFGASIRSICVLRLSPATYNSHTWNDESEKPLTYAPLLATALGLATCEKTPEDKMESAKE